MSKYCETKRYDCSDCTINKNHKIDYCKPLLFAYNQGREEEKLEHCKLMKEDGFTDSGQVKENIGTVMQPELVWFGSYYKYDVVNRN